MDRNESNDNQPGTLLVERDFEKALPDAQGDRDRRAAATDSSSSSLTTTQREADASPVCTRRWIVLMLIGGVLAALAWWVDQGVTNQLIAEQVQSRIDYIMWLPMAVSFYCIIMAILATFPNRGRLIAGFLSAVLLSGLVTHVIKFVVGRGRPDLGVGPLVFKPFNLIGEYGKYQSFPSGHSSGAFTLALLLGIYFPRARWVFYFYAACIGFERIIHNRHYTSDVLAGYVIAALTVYVCVRWLGSDFYRKELPATKCGSPSTSG